MPAWEPEFTRFVDEARAPLWRTALFLAGGDPHLAQDLLQNALFATFRSWPTLRNPQAATAYARTSLLNARIDHHRRRANRETPLAEFPDVAARPGTPDERLVLLDALARLPARQRAVLVCRYLHDLSEPETAAVLGCSVGTVKSQTHAALKRLRGMPEFTVPEGISS